MKSTVFTAAFSISLLVVQSQASDTNDANRATHVIKLRSAMNSSSAHDFILANHKAYILSQSGPKTVLSRRRRSSSILNNENRAGSGIEYYDAIFSATGFGSKLFLDSFIIDDSFTAVSGIFPDHRFVDYLHQQSNVEYVEPNQVYKAQIIRPLQEYQLMNSTSSYTQRLQAFANGTRRRGTIKTAVAPNWGQARVTQREHGGDLSQYEYDEAAGESVHVYVLDTGINTAHQDFEGRAVIDANFIDYEEGEDLGGHGTHVASKIAGQLYGIAKKAKIHSVKILDRSGDGTTSTLLKGISHVIKTAEPGKSLINLSLSGPRSRMIDEILSKAATQYNIPIFASAGNSGSDACFFSPASNPDVLSVGASDLNDDVAAYSDVGECVKVYAPGSGIESAWIGAPNSSKLLDGTSMSNPHVSGIAATLLSRKSYANTQDLYNDIIQVATRDVLSFQWSKAATPNHNTLAYIGK